MLENTANNEIIKNAIKEENFYCRKEHFEDAGFFFGLHASLMAKSAKNKDLTRFPLIWRLCRTVFIARNSTHRSLYHSYVDDDFVKSMFTILTEESKRASTAYQNIITTLNVMRDTINNFPSNEIYEIESVKVVPARQFLITCHGAITSQLMTILEIA